MKAKINKQLTNLLEITVAVMNLDDNIIRIILDKVMKEIEIDPLVKFYIKSVKIKKKITKIELVTIAVGTISLKTNITITIKTNKNNEIEHNVDSTVRLLDNLLELEGGNDDKTNTQTREESLN